MVKYKIFFILFIILIMIVLGNNAYAQPLSREEERIGASKDVFLEMVSQEDQAGAIGKLLEHASGIAIFPELTKIGLGIGVQFGEGIVLRKDPETRKWYGPAFIEIKTASVGPQIGIQDVSLILIVMDQEGIDAFKNNDFHFGANISISPGPTEKTLQKIEDFNDSIYTYSHSEGIYAGFTLEGSVIHEDSNANQAFYGRSITSKEVLEDKEPNNIIALKLIIEIEKVSN
ncbi:MAG: lipid-binding SYLF domain-containing protein [Candidatus Atribacteria bacterium]|nr:lipid-binding SYLF domain-containing protein [Candidatus Atribacteria bacterium]